MSYGEMKMIYEIVSKSDNYTFISDDIKIAKITSLILTEGQCFLKDENGDCVMNLWFILNEKELDAKIKKEFGDITEFTKTHKKEIADCMESVMNFAAKDRKEYQKTIDKMTKEQADKYRYLMLEKKSAGVSNISQRAWSISRAIREGLI